MAEDTRTLIVGAGVQLVEDAVLKTITVQVNPSYVKTVADFSDNATAGKGADDLGLRLTGAGEVATKVAPWIIKGSKGLQKNFGADGTGGTNAAVPWAAALASTGKYIEVEAGNYLLNSTPAASAVTCAGIIGHGELATTLTLGAAVAKGLAVGGAAYPREMRGFLIDGSATTGAIGMLLGDPAAGSCAVTVHRVQLKGFTGTGAVGLKCDQVLKTTLQDMTLYGSQTNLLIAGSGGGFPTTLHVNNVVNTNAVGVGMLVTNLGYQVSLRGGNIDSSGSYGLQLAPAAGVGGHYLLLEGTTLEACNAVGAYMVLIDGSAAGCLASFVMADNYFNNSYGGVRKLVDIVGAGVRGAIENPSWSTSQAANFRVQATGTPVVAWRRWNPAFSFTGNVSDSSGLALGYDGAKATWTPTYTPAGGGTFSSVSTNLARFRRVGSNLLAVDFNFAGTIAGTVTSVAMSLYNAGLTTVGANWKALVEMQAAGATITGRVSTDGAQNLVFTKLDGSAFGAGTMGAVGSVLIEITN